MLPKTRILKNLVLALGTFSPVLLGGCSSAPIDTATEEFSESAAALGVAVATCSTAGSTGYNATTKLLAITMSTPNVVFGVVNGIITVNGYSCVTSGNVALKPTDVKKVTITGTGSNEKVVIDTLGGALGASILSATGGIVVDLGSGTDQLSLRGSSSADNWKAGENASDVYFELSGDTTLDLRVIAADTIAVATSSGNDIFTARGGTLTGTHLKGSTLTAVTAVSTTLTINGGDGNDTITGGDGNDIIAGGAGDDTFKTGAAKDGDDIVSGGAGTDTVDYSTRTAALAVVLDGATSSGDISATAEADLLGATVGPVVSIDIENIIGGTAADTLTGNALSNNIKGGGGDDLISGGVNAGACTTDIDVIDGEAGNDTFDMGLASDCGDALTGGTGTDTVDYQGRSAVLTIDLDGTADDGDGTAVEKDNVKSDIEIVLGGSLGDTITGSSGDNELHGGPGADTLNGGSGNDTLIGNTGNDILNGEAGDDIFNDQEGDDAKYTVAEAHGAGDDIFNGGSGVDDKVLYTARAATVDATICVDLTKLTGNSALVAAECADDDGEGAEADKLVNIDHIVGGDGADNLTGGSTDDTLEGGPGGDTLTGGAGADRLFGDADADTLNGGADDDTLDGGADADTQNGDAGDGDSCFDDGSDTLATCEL
ncbi:MAG: calcium-binding protein [Polyangiaceae bacterium]|nr:calcium-binding protein [Polyangiaceae bacterium]